MVLDAYSDDGPELPDLASNAAFVIGADCDIDITTLSHG